MKKRYFNLLLKAAVSGLLIWLVFRNVSFSSIAYLVRGYSLEVVLAVVALQVAGVFVAAWRWRLLLPELGYARVLRFTFVGLFYSLVLPGQITGEAAKAYRFGSEYQAERSHVSSSVAVDKIMGFIGLLALTLVGLFYASIPGKEGIVAAVAVLLLALIGTLFMFASVRLNALFSRFLDRLSARWPILARPAAFAKSAIFHWHSFSRRPKTLAASAAFGVVYQLIAIIVTAILARALGMDIAFIQWFWIFGIISVAVVLPVTIAGLGVREGLFVYFLSHLGQGHASAIALSLSILALQCLVALVGGLLELPLLFRHGKPRPDQPALNSPENPIH